MLDGDKQESGSSDTEYTDSEEDTGNKYTHYVYKICSLHLSASTLFVLILFLESIDILL